MQEKESILEYLKMFICEYPVTKKGGVKRFLLMNINKIDELLKLYSFQEMLNIINDECKTKISYTNAIRTYNSIKKSSLTINNKATVTATQTKQEVVKPIVSNVKITEQQNNEVNDTEFIIEKELEDLLKSANIINHNGIMNAITRNKLTFDDFKEMDLIKPSSFMNKSAVIKKITVHAMEKKDRKESLRSIHNLFSK